MRLFPLISLFLLCFCFLQTSYTQNFQIDHWSLEDGLSNSIVNHIHQDKWGIMWFATEHGLNSFNGYEFKIYRYNPFDNQTIGANFIEKVYEDLRGNIYAVLSVGGLSKLNRQSDSFTYYNYDLENSWSNNYVHKLFFDKENKIYCGTFKGFNRINEQSRQYELLQPDSISARSIFVKSIWQQDSSTFYLGTAKGLFYYDMEEDSLSHFQYFWRDSIRKMEYRVSQFHKDSRQRLWALSTNGGIMLYEENKKQLKCFFKDIDPSLSQRQHCITAFEFRDTFFAVFHAQGMYYYDEKKEGFQLYPKAKTPKNINGAFPDGDRGIWLIANSSKLFYIQDHQCQAVFFDKINQKKNTIHIRDAFQDKEGNIWLATRGRGIYCVQPLPQQFGWMEQFEEAAQGDKYQLFVNEILEARDGNIWIGTDNGILIYQKSQNTFEHFSTGLSNNSIASLTEDHLGQIWIGTYSSISIFNPTDRSFKHYTRENSKLNSTVNRQIMKIGKNEYGFVLLMVCFYTMLIKISLHIFIN